jgi:hypothetical protein
MFCGRNACCKAAAAGIQQPPQRAPAACQLCLLQVAHVLSGAIGNTARAKETPLDLKLAAFCRENWHTGKPVCLTLPSRSLKPLIIMVGASSAALQARVPPPVSPCKHV